MEGPVLYGEFRKQLKAVQIAIRVHGASDITGNGQWKLHQASYSIEVRSDSVMLVCDQPVRQWTFLLPEGLRALPGSCSGLEWIRGDGIQMRLQLETDDDEDGDQEEGKKREEDEETGDSFLKALEDSTCEVSCSRCGAPLVLPSGGFKKVFPLPAGDWGDMAADLWCCKSKVIAEERGKMRPLQLNPEEGSIMVSDLHLLVNSRMLVRGSVDIEVKKTMSLSNPQRTGKSLNVLCQRCGNILGSIDNTGGSSQLETTKLYRYAVCIQHKGNQLPDTLNSHLQQTICDIMVSLFKSQMTFKYIIEDEEEHKPRLLIWLLGIDTRLLNGGVPSIIKDKAGCPSSHVPSSDVPPEGSRLEIQLKSQPIVKVLYQTCNTETGLRLGQEWNKDLMVHSITLTMEACLQLGLLLATSTLQAPPSMRQNEWFYGDETNYHFLGDLDVYAIFPQLRFGKIATSRSPRK